MADLEDLHKGAHVSWNTSQGRTRGIVVRTLTRKTKIDDFEVTASRDDPKILVRTDDSKKHAAHKPSSLRLLKS